MLFLSLLKDLALARRWVVLFELNLALHLLLILAGVVDVVGLRRLELYKEIL